MKKKDKQEKKYLIEVTERQLQILSNGCETLSRTICGQLDMFADICEDNWEKHHKDEEHRIGSGHWNSMRDDVKGHCDALRWLCWKQGPGYLYGVNYDDRADILWDLYQVFRHQLWLDRPASVKSRMTVDSYEPMQFGDEPLAKIYHKEDFSQRSDAYTNGERKEKKET